MQIFDLTYLIRLLCLLQLEHFSIISIFSDFTAGNTAVSVCQRHHSLPQNQNSWFSSNTQMRMHTLPATFGFYKYLLAIFVYHSNALNRTDWNWFSTYIGWGASSIHHHSDNACFNHQTANKKITQIFSENSSFFVGDNERQLWPSLTILWRLFCSEI